MGTELGWLVIGDTRKVQGVRSALQAKGQTVTPFIAQDSSQAIRGVEQHPNCQVVVVCADSFGVGILGFLGSYKKKSGRPLLVAIISQGILTGTQWRDPITKLQEEGADRAFFDTATLLNQSLVPTVRALLQERGIDLGSDTPAPEKGGGPPVSPGAGAQVVASPTRSPSPPHADERTHSMTTVADIQRALQDNIASLKTLASHHLDELRGLIPVLGTLGPQATDLREEIRKNLEGLLSDLKEAGRPPKRQSRPRTSGNGSGAEQGTPFEHPAFQGIDLDNRDQRLLKILLATPGAELTKEAIANAGGVSPGTVMTDFYRLRTKLSKNPKSAKLAEGMKTGNGKLSCAIPVSSTS